VELTEAIAVLQGSVAAYYASRGLVSILPLELPQLVRPIGMVWTHQRPLSPGTKRLMQCLEDAARASAPQRVSSGQ
jgi:DNA-binding transcriptional LysR family regulator